MVLKRYVLLTMSLMFVAAQVNAQYNETIRTGRPGQSIGPFTVGTGIFQLQSGVDYYGINDQDSSDKVYGYLNNTVIRYGITETFEVSALFDYVFHEYAKTVGNESASEGLRSFDVGMRYHILDGDGKWLPDIGFQFRLRLPVLANDYSIDHTAPRFTLVTSNPIGKFTLITNSGANWNGVDAKPQGFYVVNLSWPFTEKLSGFVENYGTFANGPTEVFWDGGLAWLLSNDLQLDIYGGYAVNHGIKSYFTSVGVSWRTKRNKV